MEVCKAFCYLNSYKNSPKIFIFVKVLIQLIMTFLCIKYDLDVC